MSKRLCSFVGLSIIVLFGDPGYAADVPGSKNTNASLPITATFKEGLFDFPGDSDWYKIQLKKDQDYAVSGTEFNQPGIINLRNSKGKILKSTKDQYHEPGDIVGFEYRAGATGTYYVEYKSTAFDDFTNDYIVRLTTDCRASRETRCSLGVGKSQAGLTAFLTDVDWIKISLSGGKSYSAELTVSNEAIENFDLDLMSSSGALIKRASGLDPVINDTLRIDYTPSSTGTFFLRIIYYDYSSASYRVSLRLNGSS